MPLPRSFSSLAGALPYLEHRLAYIGGKWCAASSNDTFQVKNPTNGDSLGLVANIGAKETEEAIVQANDAFHKWKKTTSKVCVLYKCTLFVAMPGVEIYWTFSYVFVSNLIYNIFVCTVYTKYICSN